ncbi:hypothetical protein G2W53_040135 [Senna tora]|uniref:Uncharacterized protein n=1 Tax=Senna tora TaxID=362788 RepID=A0A834T2D0_9FABA|nr:hypothetical protein G2W53_040135 [Senna tora]
MGACALTPQKCVRGERLSSSRKKQSRKLRRGGLRRRVYSRKSMGSLDMKPITLGVPVCSSIAILLSTKVFRRHC